MTKSQLISADIAALLRARTELIWIVTKEEARVEPYLFAAAQSLRYVPRTWDCVSGVLDFTGVEARIGSTDLNETLSAIATRSSVDREKGAWILRDIDPWVTNPLFPEICRKLRNLARSLKKLPIDYAQALIVISTSATIPEKLQGHATVIEWPLPDKDEITEILDEIVEILPNEMKTTIEANSAARESAVNAAMGLSGNEARDCFNRSLVLLRKLDPLLVASEKKRLVGKEKLIEWYDPLPGGLDAVGGLDIFKDWIRSRAVAYSPAAKKYKLPPPKGVLLVGIPGCGKSLCAKAVATALERPLLKFNFGAQQDKYVGESQKNIRKSFYTATIVGGVIWIDEIEKDLAGSTDGVADGGVSMDALGTFLNWWQEQSGDCFVIATANDVTKLPPELLRRFTVIWSVDLPNRVERMEIIAAGLKLYGRDLSISRPEQFSAVVDATESFTGSEIAEKMIPEALYTAFAENEREITTDDLICAAKKIIPLSKTAAEKIEKFRAWAKERATPATTPEQITQNHRSTVALDL